MSVVVATIDVEIVLVIDTNRSKKVQFALNMSRRQDNLVDGIEVLCTGRHGKVGGIF